MNKSETGMLMSILEVAYPRFYKDQADDERKKALNVWHDFFKDYDSKIVAAALKALIAADTQGFPPVIGAILDRIRQITEPPEMTEMEVWALVSRAASRGIYYAKAEYEKLPLIVQKVLGSSNTLVEWGMLDVNQFQTVTQSNFMRSYRAKVQQEKMYNSLPEDIKKIADGATHRLLGSEWD
jgi:hypothetical protein